MINVSIIGVGLIGGSLGMALRRTGRYRVTGIGRNAARLRAALKARAVDAVTTDVARGVRDADIVVVCTPVDRIAASVQSVLHFVKPGAVITDVGSVKGTVARQAALVLRPFARGKNPPVFIGGHPMAGAEKAGVQHASPGLFRQATVALTPGNKTPAHALRQVRRLWQAAGARTLLMTPGEHDRIVALTSHLPHMLAFSLCAAASALARKNPDAPRLMAGSFKDATRVAASSPADWASICHHNRAALHAVVRGFVRLLGQLDATTGNRRRLEKILEAAGAARRRMVPHAGRAE